MQILPEPNHNEMLRDVPFLDSPAQPDGRRRPLLIQPWRNRPAELGACDRGSGVLVERGQDVPVLSGGGVMDHPDVARTMRDGYPRPEDAAMEGVATVRVTLSFPVDSDDGCLTMSDVEEVARTMLSTRLTHPFEVVEVEGEDFDPHS